MVILMQVTRWRTISPPGYFGVIMILHGSTWYNAKGGFQLYPQEIKDFNSVKEIKNFTGMKLLFVSWQEE